MDEKQLRHKVREMVRYAVKRGELIKPSSCERCGEEHPSSYITAHHHKGYEPPNELDVQWLCRKCHGAVHGGVLNIPAEVHRRTMTAINDALGPEGRRERARHAALSVSPEQRVINTKKARAASTSWYGTMTPEERSAKMRDQVSREKQVTCSCGKIGRGAVIANHRKRTNCS